MISVRHLTFAYALTSTAALWDISFDVPAGQFCALVGPNRAGKSTLCYALSGFIPHFYRGQMSGEVTVADSPVAATPLSELAGKIGLVFQNPFNQITGARMTVRGEIAFGLENMGVPRGEMLTRVDEALEMVGLSGLADRSPGQLSGGQQQRLALASVLVLRPQVLVLDEPTSQLDPLGTREVFSVLVRLVQSTGTTVVLVEHKLEWVGAFADRVIALANGQIIADGPPRNVLQSTAGKEAGVGQTRYTQAARLARERGLVSSDSRLPVTLEQAVSFFSPRSADEYIP